jgi:hypothetical protein
MDKNILKKQDNTYKLIITPELEEKIRFLCARFPNNEYSGVLFYDYTGRFEDNSLVLTAKDFCLMDYGSATYTEFDKSAEICNYMPLNISSSSFGEYGESDFSSSELLEETLPIMAILSISTSSI